MNNRIIIGNKHVRTYVAIATYILQNVGSVHIIGGGKNISKAVSVLEILKSKFQFSTIDISTTTREIETGKVSVIEISAVVK